MGIVKRAGDLVYTFRFLKLLTTDFKDTQAFELGIIDAKGKKLKRPDSAEERNAYTPFHRLVFNIKKLLPASKLGSYLSALYLVKEQFSITEKQLKEGLNHFGVDHLDSLLENTSWLVLEDGQLSPGDYKISCDKVLNVSLDEVVRKYDYINVADNSYPIGDVFGVSVYEATHKRSNQKVYVTAQELLI